MGDRAGDDVSRGELAAGVERGQEAPPLRIAQQRPLAPHRLGDEERGVRSLHGERGGMELEELEVLERGAGPPGRGEPVPGGHGGVRGVGEELPRTAGGEHGGARPHPDAGAVGREQLGADHLALRDLQVHQGGVLEQGEPAARSLGRPGAGGADQGVLDRAPGRVAAGVEDPGPVVGALEAERAGAVLGAVEDHSAGEELSDRRRALRAQHLHGLRVAEAGTGGEGVAGVRGGAVPGADGPGNAALGAARGALGELALGHQQHVAALGGGQGRGEPRDAGADHEHLGAQRGGLSRHAQRSGTGRAAGRTASMRSSAVQAGSATSGPTVMRLRISPSSSDSSTQAR